MGCGSMRRSKADQDGAGATLALVRGRRSVTDPVRAVATWRRRHGSGVGSPVALAGEHGNVRDGCANMSCHGVALAGHLIGVGPPP